MGPRSNELTRSFPLGETMHINFKYRILVSIYDRDEDGDLIEVDTQEHTFLIIDPAEMERLQNLQTQVDLGGKMLISPLNNQ
jgi:hypothetical protein